MEAKKLNLTLNIWRQKNNKSVGSFAEYKVQVSPDASFLEMLDELKKLGGYLCSTEEREQLRAYMWPDGKELNRSIVAKPVAYRLKMLLSFSPITSAMA